jgi:hypothetical protein
MGWCSSKSPARRRGERLSKPLKAKVRRRWSHAVQWLLKNSLRRLRRYASSRRTSGLAGAERGGDCSMAAKLIHLPASSDLYTQKFPRAHTLGDLSQHVAPFQGVILSSIVLIRGFHPRLTCCSRFGLRCASPDTSGSSVSPTGTNMSAQPEWLGSNMQ